MNNKAVISLFVILLLAIALIASLIGISSNKAEPKIVGRLFGKHTVPNSHAFKKHPLSNYKLPQTPSNLGVVLKNCGSASDPIQIASLALTPNATIVLGANLTIQASGSTSEAITAANLGKVAVTIAKAIFGVYVDIPCVDNVGSCTYTDLCTLLLNASCPDLQTYGYNCKCPFAAQSYYIPNTQNPNNLTVHLPVPPSYLDWLTNGDYEVQGTLYDVNSNRLICANVMLSLAVVS